MLKTLSRFHRRLIVSAVVGLGIAISAAASWYVRDGETQRTRLAFERRAETQASFAREKLQNYEEIVHSLRNLFYGSRHVARSEFAAVAHDLLTRHPGVQALQWVPLVSAAERANIEANATRETGRPFFFRQFPAPGQFERAADKPEYLPILYVEPLESNELVLGFDLTTAVTKDTLLRAREQRQLLATPLFQLAQTPVGQLGVILAVPVFKPAASGGEYFVGFVQGVFIARTMLAEAHRLYPDTALDVAYSDVTDSAEAAVPIYRAIGGQDATDSAPPPDVRLFEYRQILQLGDRQWKMTARPTADWLEAQSSNLPILILLRGLLTTALAGFFVQMLLKRTQRIEHEVAIRTAELRRSQELLHEDIRRRIATEKELQENRRQLDNLISQLPGAAFRCTFDENMTALFLSDGMLRLTGYPAADFIAGTIQIAHLTNPADRPALRAALTHAVRERGSFEVEYRILHRDGTEKWVLARGRPVFAEDGELRFIEGLAIDINALKQAEAQKLAIERQLLESQKMESLGTLAGGIAHDFNNILTAILGNASLIRLQDPSSPLAGRLRQIETSVKRAADLCQQMLAYAGRSKAVMTRLNLSELVRDTAALVEVSIHKNTRLNLHLAPDLPAVQGDASQLRQIVMNLVINAAEAIGEQSGVLRVATFVRTADVTLLRAALHQPKLPAGTYVGLEVEDNGGGIPQEILARIFEPFFTTKFAGRGLGLAACLGIVNAHRGALYVDSTPGKGTVFRLLLPAVSGAPEATATVPAVAALHGTVLIVDDDETVRAIAGALLQAHGLSTLTAPDGETALQVYQTHRERIDLVLLDLSMPGLSGEETYRRLHAIAPNQPVIIMSGHGESQSVSHYAGMPEIPFLQKPFEIQTLLKTIEKTIG